MKKSKGTTAVEVQVEEVKGFNLTEKEIIFLQEFGRSDFYEHGLDSQPWDYSVNDNLPYTGKVRSGVISSLEQKGVIGVYKKVKGDIAGTYWLTDAAKLDQEIVDLVDGQRNPKVIELPKEEVKEEVIEALPVTILVGTWKDGMEAKSFENSVLQILKLKFNCEVSQIKNTNKNEFEVTGLPEDVELLSIAFHELVAKIRVATKVAYKESDKTFSLFRFTTNYHKVLLETMDMEVE